jgi:1-acyl-sn-glycerol-3-phosphate acyltransferase
MNNKVDLNKNINSRCSCGYGLPWIRCQVVMMEPCEHLVHYKCYKKQNKEECPICHNKIIDIVKAEDFKKNKNLYQKCIDIISMSNCDNMSSSHTEEVFENIPDFIDTITKIPFSKGMMGAKQLVENIFNMNDITIHVTGMSKLKKEPKVFIANHTSHLDYLTILYVLETGFLASSTMNDTFLGQQCKHVIPLLLVDRGKDANTVEKMREYVKKTGSICLFPEGIFTHPNTCIRFRTGAFHIGYPIYPIVLQYDPIISDSFMKDFIMKISSGHKFNIYMDILDPVYPPFDDNQIEQIRRNMALRGNMALSRVSNRDIVEKKVESPKL